MFLSVYSFYWLGLSGKGFSKEASGVFRYCVSSTLASPGVVLWLGHNARSQPPQQSAQKAAVCSRTSLQYETKAEMPVFRWGRAMANATAAIDRCQRTRISCAEYFLTRCSRSHLTLAFWYGVTPARRIHFDVLMSHSISTSSRGSEPG